MKTTTTTAPAQNTAHTPGPWQTAQDEVGNVLIYGRNSWLVATAQLENCEAGRSRLAKERRNANARLIAAAPELLAALEASLRVMESVAKTHGYDTSVGVVPQARAALARAKGL